MANPYLKYTQQPAGAAPNPYMKYTDPNYSGPMTVKQEAAPPMDAAHAEARAAIDANPDKFRNTGALDPYLRKVGQGVSLGWTDNISAGLAAVRDTVKHGGSLGDNYTKEMALQDELLKDANKQTGFAGNALEMVSSLPTYLGGGEIIGAATKAAPAIVSRLLSSPVAQDALLGASTGAVDAAGHGHSATQGAVGGSAGGIVGGAIGRGLGSGIDALAGKVKEFISPAPVTDFQKLGADALNKFRTSGIEVTRPGLDELQLAFQKVLKEGSYNKADMAGLEPAFNQWDRLVSGKGTITPGGRMGHVANADELRNMFNALGRGNLTPEETHIAGGMRKSIQDILDQNNPTFVQGGDAKLAAENWREANKNFTTDFKLKAFDEAKEKADDAANRSFFNANVETPLKTQAQNLRKGRGDWTPDEFAAIEGVYKPGRIPALISGIGRTAPTSGILGPLTTAANIATGAATGALPLSAMLAAATQGAKFAGDSMIRGRMNNIEKVIRNGGVAPIVEDSMVNKALSRGLPIMGMDLGDNGAR